jgi:hypothetical protein
VHYTTFQASAAVQMRSSVIWIVTLRMLVVVNRRSETTTMAVTKRRQTTNKRYVTMPNTTDLSCASFLCMFLFETPHLDININAHSTCDMATNACRLRTVSRTAVNCSTLTCQHESEQNLRQSVAGCYTWRGTAEVVTNYNYLHQQMHYYFFIKHTPRLHVST